MDKKEIIDSMVSEAVQKAIKGKAGDAGPLIFKALMLDDEAKNFILSDGEMEELYDTLTERQSELLARIMNMPETLIKFVVILLIEKTISLNPEDEINLLKEYEELYGSVALLVERAVKMTMAWCVGHTKEDGMNEGFLDSLINFN